MPAVGETGGRDVLVYTEGDRKDTSTVVAVALADRHELWRASLDAVSGTGVTIDGDHVLLGDRSANLYEFDLATGTPARWSPKALGGGGIDAPPAAANGEIYAVTRDRVTGNVRVSALKESTGSEDWDFTPKFSSGTGSAVTVQG